MLCKPRAKAHDRERAPLVVLENVTWMELVRAGSERNPPGASLVRTASGGNSRAPAETAAAESECPIHQLEMQRTDSNCDLPLVDPLKWAEL
jgi:hypothetical protein